MDPITLKVLAKNFAAGPPFVVDNEWHPRPVTIYRTDPPGADVIAAVLPTKGGMRVIVYNREATPVSVWVEPRV